MDNFSAKRMSAVLLYLLTAITTAQQSSSQLQDNSGFQYVDPLIGTINGGLWVAVAYEYNELIMCRPCVSWRDTAIWLVIQYEEIQLLAF